jgi:hypothetical protein
MNERIKELAEQAGFYNMGIGLIIGIEEYHQKFAELIVRECLEIANKNRTGMEIKTNTRLTADAIKKHFGVDE